MVNPLTVETYESIETPQGFRMSKTRATEVSVSGVTVSYGDRSLIIEWDEERDRWEITVQGKATVWHE